MPPSPTSASTQPLRNARFVVPGRTPEIPAEEQSLVALTCLHLCFLPWALGGMHVGSQILSLALSLGSAVLVCLRWPDFADPGRLTRPALRLVRFPGFWAGLFVLGYILVQALNPSFRYVQSAEGWWLEPANHFAWLPHGVDAPFAKWSPWRALLVYGSLWLLVCSVWAGFRYRRSYRTLFSVLVINGGALALLGILQQLTDAREIFWSYLPSNASFVSSFIYRNHAGPYFNLMVALAVGLAWWHFRRSYRRHGRPSPALAFTFLGALAGVMVVFSYSRMSILMLLAFMVAAGFAAGLRLFHGAEAGRGKAERLVLILIFAGFVATVAASLRVERVWQRFATLMADPVASLQERTIARQAAAEMFSDRWLLGWGAGSFRHGFPLYAQKYPEIYQSTTGTLRYWEHAHNDLIQYPIELGVLGVLPLVFALGHAVWRLFRQRVWRHALLLPVAITCLLVMLHAWADFVFQNPAVLFTWATLLVGAARSLEFDQPAENPASR